MIILKAIAVVYVLAVVVVCIGAVWFVTSCEPRGSKRGKHEDDKD